MAVWTVDSLADNSTTDEYTTLREAITSASDGDIIDFAPSLTASGPATILLDGEVLTVDQNVTIVGPGMDLLTIDAQGESRVFMIDTGVEATISGLTITGGASAGGGGIYTIGDLTLDSVRVTGNASSGHSGGIFVYGTLTLHASLVNNNEAVGIGGGIYVNDSAYAWIYDSTIDGNEAAGAAGIFGYLQAGDRLLIQGSTISNNHATGIGGGLVVQSPSNTDAAIATLVNTTVSGNIAAYSGGIRANYERSHVRLVNSTIAFNQGDEAGGLQVTSSATVTLLNTIVAENKNLAGTSDSDIANWATIHATSAHNLIGRGGSGGLEDEEDGNIVLVGAETAGLAPLGDYGGRTKTHALLPHSMAINAGDDGLWLEELTWDGRGERYRRKNGADIDIGAVEANVVQLESSDPIAAYGTEGADGIYVGTEEAGNDYVALDSVGGYKFLVDIGSASAISVQALGGDDAVSIDPAVTKAATIDGGAGDDLLVGGSGDDTIYGGAGADIIHGGAGADTLYGYLDDYEFLGGDGADTIFAKDGDDTDLIYVEVGSDIYEVDDEAEIAEGLATAPAPAADSWQAIVDTSGNGFGPGWNHAGVDRLFLFDDDPFTLRWVRADGFLIDFTDFNEPSDRDKTASVVTQDGTYYIRTDKFGNKSWYLKAGDNAGALVKQVNRLGVGYEYGYTDLDDEDAAHEITSITIVRPGQDGETYTLTDDDFRITEIVDPFGRVADLTYDENDLLYEIILPAPDPGAPGVRPTFAFTYDAYGFLSSVTDADGRETTFAFAAANGAGMLTVTYPDTGVRQLLPVTGDVFNEWRSQLGAWAAVIPEFRFKMSLSGMDDAEDRKSGYEIDQLGRTTAFQVDWSGALTQLYVDPRGLSTLHPNFYNEQGINPEAFKPYMFGTDPTPPAEDKPTEPPPAFEFKPFTVAELIFAELQRPTKPPYKPQVLPNNDTTSDDVFNTIGTMWYEFIRPLFNVFVGPTDKLEIVEGHVSTSQPAINPDLITGQRHNPNRGNHLTIPNSELFENDIAGTNGLGPCIGVIIQDKDRVFVAHFDAGDYPFGTIAQNFRPLFWSPGSPPLNAWVFGGDNGPISNGTLGSVVSALEVLGIPYHYYDLSGGYIDRNGNFYTYPTNVPGYQSK